MSTIALATPPLSLVPVDEVGALGVYRLKRYWSRIMLAMAGKPIQVSRQERHHDHLLLHALGLGLEQTSQYLGREQPTFAQFEHWIVATTGGVNSASYCAHQRGAGGRPVSG